MKEFILIKSRTAAGSCGSHWRGNQTIAEVQEGSAEGRNKIAGKANTERDRIGVSQVVESVGLWELQVGVQEQL